MFLKGLPVVKGMDRQIFGYKSAFLYLTLKLHPDRYFRPFKPHVQYMVDYFFLNNSNHLDPLDQ